MLVPLRLGCNLAGDGWGLPKPKTISTLKCIRAVTTKSLMKNAWEDVSKRQSFISSFGKWLESGGWNLCIIWVSTLCWEKGPFTTSSNLLVQFPHYLSVWLVTSVSFRPLAKCFEREIKEPCVLPYKLPDVSFNLSSVTLALGVCTGLLLPCWPHSSLILSFVFFTDIRHVTVTCLMSIRVTISKRLASTYLEIINHCA